MTQEEAPFRPCREEEGDGGGGGGGEDTGNHGMQRGMRQRRLSSMSQACCVTGRGEGIGAGLVSLLAPHWHDTNSERGGREGREGRDVMNLRRM